MLILRKEQLQAISNATDIDLVRKISLYLQENHAADLNGVCKVELDRRIRFGLDRARRHTLEIDSHLLLFVVLMFTVSPTFDEHPLTRPVFDNPEIPADEKLAALPNHLTGDDWIEIKNTAGPDGWQ